MNMYYVIITIIIAILTVMDVMYALNIRAYVTLLRRGLVRVKVRYCVGKQEKILRGWAFLTDLNVIMNNPISHSASFLKVYEHGDKEVVIVFSNVKKLEVLEENFFSVVFSRKVYI